jgi:hypothetical protein
MVKEGGSIEWSTSSIVTGTETPSDRLPSRFTHTERAEKELTETNHDSNIAASYN